MSLGGNIAFVGQILRLKRDMGRRLIAVVPIFLFLPFALFADFDAQDKTILRDILERQNYIWDSNYRIKDDVHVIFQDVEQIESMFEPLSRADTGNFVDSVTYYGLITGWSPYGYGGSPAYEPTIYTNGILGRLGVQNEHLLNIHSTAKNIDSNLFYQAEKVFSIESLLTELVERQRMQDDIIEDGLYEGTNATNSPGRKPYLEQIKDEVAESNSNAVKQASATTNLLQSIRQAIYEATNKNQNVSIPLDGNFVSNIVSLLMLNTQNYTVEEFFDDMGNLSQEEIQEYYGYQGIMAQLLLNGINPYSVTQEDLNFIYAKYGQSINLYMLKQVLNSIFDKDTTDMSDVYQQIEYIREQKYGTSDTRNEITTNVVPLLKRISEGFASFTNTPIHITISNTVTTITQGIGEGVEEEEVVAPTVETPDADDFSNDELVERPDTAYSTPLNQMEQDTTGVLEDFEEASSAIEEMRDNLRTSLEDIFEKGSDEDRKVTFTVPLSDLSEGSEDLEIELDFTLPKAAKDKLDNFWQIIIGATKMTINVVLFMLTFKAFVSETATSEFSRYFDDL